MPDPELDHRHDLSLPEAATRLGLPSAAVVGLAEMGYLQRSGRDGLGQPRFRLSDVKAFVARNADNGGGFAPFGDRGIGDWGDANPEELLRALDGRSAEMAERAFSIFARLFPETEGWSEEARTRFVEQAQARFEAILAVTGSGAVVDEALVGDLEDVGADAAWEGSSLPQLLVILRISRDLVVQTAVLIAEQRGGHWGMALTLLLTRILPAIDRLTDALARGYWAAIVGREEADRARYQHVVESSSDGIYEVDLDGSVTYVNPSLELLLGRRLEDVRGLPLGAVLTPLDPADDLAVLQRAEPSSLVFEHRRADGSRRVFDAHGLGRLYDGELVGYQGVVRDITAATELEADKNEFLSLVTNDLRQPLTAVIGMAATIESHADELTPAQAVRLAGQIRRQSERMARLADDLHDVSRIEAQTLVLAPRPVHLRSAVEAGIVAADPQAAVVVDIPEDLEVLADARRLEQVVANLVDNALEHGAPPIVVCCDGVPGRDGRVAVHFSDRGLGVPEVVVPTLFSGVRTLRRSARERSRGSGLGLALVKGIVEAMGGQAWYETPGGVCTFSLALMAVPPRR